MDYWTMDTGISSNLAFLFVNWNTLVDMVAISSRTEISML